MKLVVLLLLCLIIPVSADFGVSQESVYTYSVLELTKLYGNNAPTDSKTVTDTKYVRIDDFTTSNVSLSISEHGKTSTRVVNSTYFGAEVAALNFTRWGEILKADPTRLEIPAFQPVSNATISTLITEGEFDLTYVAIFDNGTTYTQYAAISYNTTSGVRTSFAYSIKEEYGTDTISVFTYSETLSSSNGKFPTNNRRIPVDILPMLFALIITVNLLRIRRGKHN